MKTKSIGPESKDYLLDDDNDDCAMQPRYLEAFTQNNLPRHDWGPMKSVNHYGFYKHLCDDDSVDNIDFDLTRKSVVSRLESQNLDDNYVPDKSMTKMNIESP